MAFFIDDKQIYLDRPFKGKNGVQYPSNWLRLATPKERYAIGIVEKEEPIKAAPKDVKQAPADNLEDAKLKRKNKIVKDNKGEPIIRKGKKTVAIEQERKMMLDLLADTDWYVIRYIETQEEMPVAIKEYRDEVRRVHAVRCAKILECLEIADFNKLFIKGEASNLEAYPEKLR